MAKQSYVSLGERLILGIDHLLSNVLSSPPYRWSSGVLRRFGLRGRTLVIAVPWIWLLLFFLIPFIIVLKISFAETRWLGSPPYSPLFEWVDAQSLQVRFNLGNYLFLLRDSLYLNAFLSSLKVAAISTICCLLLGYPMAYAIARANANWRNTLLLLIILPFWTSFLLRVYAWMGLLGNNGPINQLLMALGRDEPLVMLQTDFAMYIGIVYSYLPFMILPLYSNLEKHDLTLLEAAVDLGCKPFKAFLSITLPLSIPGVIAGSMLVFIPAVGEFVIPRLLGGTDSLMIGRVLWDEYFLNRNWPIASAVAIALLVLLVIPIMVFQRFQMHEAGASARR
jgi:putrescine transport system permease protein